MQCLGSDMRDSRSTRKRRDGAGAWTRKCGDIASAAVRINLAPNNAMDPPQPFHSPPPKSGAKSF